MSLAPNLPSTTKKELLSFQNGNSHGRLPCPKQHRHRRRHRSPHGWNRQSAMVGTRWRNRLARGDWLHSVLGRDPPPCMTQRPNLPFTYLGHRGERRPPSSCPQRYRAQRCSSPTAIIGCVRGMGFHQRHRGFPPKRMGHAAHQRRPAGPARRRRILRRRRSRKFFRPVSPTAPRLHHHKFPLTIKLHAPKKFNDYVL